ncbi:UDP-N-acetylglucosamine 1-carboxyvinyltransferase [Phosphitispora sp. TUW77]|uniref:UDP-N-acetylglucosamine 1-carboxyvinyltransferase n=1 Tax=Phosphitispora sp. TUW77 TaxID=3152361 RepID=UPI003AB23EF1
MEKLVVRGGKPLYGKVRVSGAKNAVLPIIASTLLAEEGICQISGVPYLADVETLIDLLRFMGAEATRKEETLTVDAKILTNTEAPYDYVSKMRASFLVMGPLLGRYGYAKTFLPGGCKIGTRPIDLHLKGFVSLGAEIVREDGFVVAKVKDRLKGGKVYLDFPSVGATENIIMAAILAEGTTYIQNAAEEPEIVDLANFLNAMGAKVTGAGTNVVKIEGQASLKGAVHQVIPDRVEAGTYMVAAALTGGEIYIENVITEHLKPVIAKLEETGVKIQNGGSGIRVSGPENIEPVNIQTLPYPGFPTDMQPQITALLTRAKGTSMITETVFENRFMHTEELGRMGADIWVDGRVAVIKGVSGLNGARVQATDLRGGAALILAGLVAKGETEINFIHHIDRGYEKLEDKFCRLGADIRRVNAG